MPNIAANLVQALHDIYREGESKNSVELHL